MRKKNFIFNSFSSLGYQIALLISSFVLPNLIIRTYGTDVNGLVISIMQFLRVISLGEFGITAVIQSSLYEPLAKKDNRKIGQIVFSSDKIFRKISFFLFIYVGILCLIYPLLFKSKYEFDYFFVISLILILSFNSFTQYLFAFTNSELLAADQKAFVYLIPDIITLVFSTILCSIEMYFRIRIHIVELTMAIGFLLKPILTSIYIRRKYDINRRETYEKDPINQKWNGVAQHLGYYVFTNTDIIVLTLFSDLKNVSIYSVYVLVLNGLMSISSMLEQGIGSVLGELWAIGDKEKTYDYFSIYEWFVFALSTFLYGCTISLIVPFVRVYTRNVSDANYILPLFGIYITIAYLIQNIRRPYHILIQSVGRYKETQASYIVSALVNLFLSIIMVYRFGLIGVAIGTLVGALVETIWQAVYLYRWVLNKSILRLVRLLCIYGITFVLAFCICNLFDYKVYSYFSWFKLALPVSAVWLIIILLFSIIFYNEHIRYLLSIIKK